MTAPNESEGIETLFLQHLRQQVEAARALNEEVRKVNEAIERIERLLRPPETAIYSGPGGLTSGKQGHQA
jgi:hypothetical protein